MEFGLGESPQSVDALLIRRSASASSGDLNRPRPLCSQASSACSIFRQRGLEVSPALEHTAKINMDVNPLVSRDVGAKAVGVMGSGQIDGDHRLLGCLEATGEPAQNPDWRVQNPPCNLLPRPVRQPGPRRRASQNVRDFGRDDYRNHLDPPVL